MDVLKIRKAAPQDLTAVTTVFKEAIKVMDKSGIFQWDEVYPNEEDIKQDIEKSEMYLGEIGGKIAVAFVLNREYDKEYEKGNWKYKNSSFFVIHRLCVNPAFQNKGVGTKTMFLIEDMLKNRGIETIRLDAFSLNPFALKMYEKIGYIKIGEANFRKGLFYLFEKKI